MLASEFDVAHGLPTDAISLANELQQVIHDIGKCMISKEIKSSSTQRYARRVIKKINKEEEKA